MHLVNQNIRYLRKKENLTQEAFAAEFDIKRSKLGAYEEGRAKPNYELLQELSRWSNYSIDELVTKDLSKYTKTGGAPGSTKILAITVDKEGNENIELVPQKAAAGYMTGYEDPGYLEELPRFNLPNLPVGTYRAFEIKGHSMLPVQPGTIVICEYEDDPSYVKSGQCYIILSKHEGIVYKRVFKQEDNPQQLLLRSDNTEYEPYTIGLDEVLELWKAKYLISAVDSQESQPSIDDMAKMMAQLKSEIDNLKNSN